MTDKKTDQTIQQCQVPRLSYLAAALDADKRMAMGQEQAFCVVCERFKWADELCKRAIVVAQNLNSLKDSENDNKVENKTI